MGLSTTQVGLFPTALFVVSALSVLLLRGAMDRHGPISINGLALISVTAGNGLFAIAPTFETLLAAKALAGIGGGIGFVAGIRYIIALYGERRPHLGQGIYGAGYPLGSALGIAAMPPLATLAGGWRGAFLLSTLALLAMVACWFALAPRVRGTLNRVDIRAALRDGNVRWVAMQHAAGFGLTIAAASWISVFLIDEYGLPIIAAGFTGSALTFVGVFTRPIGGWLVANEVIGTIPIMRASQALNVIGLALIALPGRPLGLALLGVVLLGTGTSLAYAAVFNTAAASLPDAPAAAQSLTGIGGSLASITGPPLMGVLVQHFGFTAAWTAIALVPTTALIGTFFMRGEESLRADEGLGLSGS